MESWLSACVESCELVSVLRERRAVRALAVVDGDSPADKTASIYKAADKASEECGIRLDVLVLRRGELDDLVADGPGNDAKLILEAGTTLRGRVPAVRGRVEPPDPTGITEDEFEYNMQLHGFELMGTARRMRETPTVRPEYVVAGAMFRMHMRRISSGIPVVLCNARMNYGLLMYVARSYGFAGRLLGVMSDIRAEGRLSGVVDEPVSILKKCGTVPKMPFGNSVREALDAYAC